jgi:predicted TIM-barrel fold metal-dependent hydrolase
MNVFHEDQSEWLTRHTEPVVDPEQPIIDPHHHLWPDMLGHVYNVDEFAADTNSGHNIVGTVFMECGAAYREEGPDEERSLGETEYVLKQAQRAKQLDDAAPILGMVGRVDLRDTARVDELLDTQGDWYRHALECFGAERCMFESNFPVDRLSLSYTVYWNAMKKLVAGASPSEKDHLFHATARRVYRLED